MKRPSYFIAGVVSMVLSTCFMTPAQAQDEDSASKFSAGIEFYSNYVWRGSKLGTGPSVQPAVQFQSNGLTIGVWGAFDADGYAEADPYISYSFPFGLSLGVTDYYYPDMDLFDASAASGSHALELNAGYGIGGFSLSANYIVNEAGGAASAGGDMYFQAGYDCEHVSLFVGGGNGWHTVEGNFNICNIGIGTSTEVNVTDNFSFTVSGQVIVNPDREKLYLVGGISF